MCFAYTSSEIASSDAKSLHVLRRDRKTSVIESVQRAAVNDNTHCLIDIQISKKSQLRLIKIQLCFCFHIFFTLNIILKINNEVLYRTAQFKGDVDERFNMFIIFI